MIAARNTLATGDFKDREKAFRSLTPSLQALRRMQAKKRMSVTFAKKFALLFKKGKIPNWVVEIQHSPNKEKLWIKSYKPITRLGST